MEATPPPTHLAPPANKNDISAILSSIIRSANSRKKGALIQLPLITCLPVYLITCLPDYLITVHCSLYSLQLVQTPGNDVVLVFRSQLAEITAPAPHAYDQVLMLLGVSLGVQ